MMNRRDKEAMQLAIDLTLRMGGEDERQIRKMLGARPWEEVGHFAAFARQCDALDLKPWEAPPASTEFGRAVDAYGGRLAEIKLLQRMLDLGISQFHPDPPAAAPPL
jgi:hypothetical protein